MQNNPASDLHKTTRPEFTALFGQAQLVLDETPKASTPFGGLASFVTFLGQIGYAQEVPQGRPFAAPTSNNAIPLAHPPHRVCRLGGGGGATFCPLPMAAGRSRPARAAGAGAFPG